ncbi:MAG: 16S rRNA (adenine(1518)-N(6)/adenine(1519)-N(6))-dimethyltransferase RsmA [Firmicutes bacterium]|nr:16S rRNA (adenine(1518)-N(6)/adenine(1519)-N(6))-dimethyltransferase RsmA [Bacillota bacterium]
MSRVYEELKEAGFSFKKKFGQNFITDRNLLEAIASDANISREDTVLEIGVGAGTLTEVLAATAKHILAVEIDVLLNGFLYKKFEDAENVLLLFSDILEIKKEDLLTMLALEKGGKFKVVANLPYYITTPIIFKLIDDFMEELESITVMVQKEVAERIVAKPGTKEYGIISVKLNAVANTRISRTVSRKMFRPEPNVDSAMLVIEFDEAKKKEFGDVTFEQFKKVVSGCFGMRRKTLHNNLVSALKLDKVKAKEIITKLGFSEDIRAERLTYEDFIRLTREIF